MRRGVSTVIGTLVFMIITVSTLSSVIMFIQYQNDLLMINSKILDKKINTDKVDIITSNYCNVNCKLTVGVYNESDHNINILSLWLIDNRTSNIIIQRDMNTYIMSKKVTILLDEYNLQGGVYTIKIVTNDGSIKEKTINIPSLELNLKSIVTPSIRGGNVTILAHITNIGDSTIENVNVYISGIGNRNITIATVDRLERLQSTTVTYEINNINYLNNLTISIYAEGINQLGKIIRSNVEVL